MHEFEIKISRSDFKADAKKEKATQLVNGFYIAWGQQREIRRPNYFYYIVPDGLISVDEVPSYAGLGYAQSRFYIRIVKQPARLHAGKINDWQKRQLHRALTFRYWKQRIRAEAVV